MSRKAFVSLGLLALTLVAADSAMAARAKDAVEACKLAATAEAGEDVVAKLIKVKSRGANYEVWLNLRGEQEQKTFCYLRRAEVETLVTEEGAWKGRNPRRPEITDSKQASSGTPKVGA
jgi:hypothetical protein